MTAEVVYVIDVAHDRKQQALLDNDIQSIRALREWVVSQPTAPQILKDKEAVAVAERAKPGN